MNQRNTDRILDANANRAREALRVMEEAARFVLDDARLAADLKAARHDLAVALAALGPITPHRDTPGDVGTAVAGRGEYARASIESVATAAGKRLSEALRCLEEYGKLRPDGGAFARGIEQLRYRGYDLEQRLALALSRRRAPQWRVCVLVSESLCERHPWLDVAEACLDAGADCLQLREKDLDGDELADRAARLVDLAGQTKKVSVIVNDRVDVALAAGAHGVHLGQSDLSVEAARRVAGPDTGFWIGVSTHSLVEARRAVRAGTDYCGVGAMYPTATKRRKPSGLAYLQRFVRDFPGTPHLAIGGVTPDNAAELAAAGARGVAVSSVVCGAQNPATVVRKLRRAMK
ncbi:MAG: thiamine phosphate synthase [Planctomycetota bacterium]|jgi:thiamine-phosphate pyrophosphorylase